MINTLNIIDKYVPKEERVLVAKTVLLAQDIREESWIEAIDCYSKNHFEATEEALKSTGLDELWKMIGWWNLNAWNDIQDWAKGVIGEATE